MVKYKTRLHSSNDPQTGNLHYGPTMELVKEFRAQRNFYISGTALFLWFVIKRLLALITNAAQLIAENSAAKSQAESASRTANALLDAQKNAKEETKSSKGAEITEAEFIQRLKAKEEEIDALQRSYRSAKVDLDAMKKQSESVAREYDNLLKEHAKLTARLERVENEGFSSVDSKKAN